MDLCFLVPLNFDPHSHVHTKGVEMSLWPLKLPRFTHSLLNGTRLIDMFILPTGVWLLTAVSSAIWKLCRPFHYKNIPVGAARRWSVRWEDRKANMACVSDCRDSGKEEEWDAKAARESGLARSEGTFLCSLSPRSPSLCPPPPPPAR